MVTIKTPEETLVLVPHILGYRPRSAFVMCGLDSHCKDAAGIGTCVGPIVRFDYRNEPLSVDHGRFLAQVTRRHDVTVAVLVLYCASLNELDTGELSQRIALIHSMVTRAQRPGSFLFTFALDSEHFVRLDDGRRLVRNVSELESCASAAELVFQGSAPGTEQPGMALPAVAADQRARAVSAAYAVLGEGKGKEAARSLWNLLDAAQARHIPFSGSFACPNVEEARSSLESEAPKVRWPSSPSRGHSSVEAEKPMESAEMAAAGECRAEDSAAGFARAVGEASASLTVPLNRDTALAWGLEPNLRRGSDADANRVAEILAEAVVRPPNISRVKVACAVLDLIAAYDCPGAVDALAASAYLHWWACLNSIAADRVARALRKDPGHSLTGLLVDALSSGMMAPWYSYACGAA